MNLPIFGLLVFISILNLQSTIAAKSVIRFKIPKPVLDALARIKASIKQKQPNGGLPLNGALPLNGDQQFNGGLPLSSIQPMYGAQQLNGVLPFNGAQQLNGVLPFNGAQQFNGDDAELPFISLMA